MSQAGSYQFEHLESRHAEAKLLAERSQMRLEGFLPLLRRFHLPETGQFLEVGCGHGLRTRTVAENFPDLQVVGLDRSRELLEMAEGRYQQNLSFVEGDIYDLSSLVPESFDFIYARLVFMHLQEPLRALENLRRLLKPGGRIVIEDADRDCMFFEPAPESFSDFWGRVQEGQRRLGGDPNVGRKLAVYLKQMNFSNVTSELQPIVGDGEDIAFLARTLLPSLNIYLDVEDRHGGEVAIGDLIELSKAPNATFYHLWFVVGGIKV